MNGKHLYFAVFSLLGTLCSLVSFPIFFPIFPLLIFLLYKFKSLTLKQIAFLILTFLVYVLTGYHAVISNKTVIPETTTSFILEYNQDTKIDGDLFQVVAVDKRYKEKLLVRYKIQSALEKEELENQNFYVCQSAVTGTLSRPPIAKNPNGFDYRDYLASKQTYWILDIQESPLKTCSPQKTNLINRLKEIRFKGINYLEKQFPPEISSLSSALIFGDRSGLAPDVLENYQKTGIVHLLAISGLHVSLLIGMVLYMGIRIGLTKEFMIHLLLMLLPFYAIMTGGSPSVIRAVIMIFLVLLTVKWKRRVKLLPIDAISLALMFYLLLSPMVIFDIGFQLSFTVSTAIILSATTIFTRCQSNFSRMIATSLTSQLAALPFLLYHYFEISFISILANLLYIPLFSFVYLPGVYILFILQIVLGRLPVFLTVVMVKIISLSDELIDQLANFPFARYTPGRPGPITLVIYFFALAVFFIKWEKKNHPSNKYQFVLLLLFLLSFQGISNKFTPFGEVTMIDVGQGDSIFIHLPFGRGNYLIDTGGILNYAEEEWKKRSRPYEVGRDVVVPFLKSKGITVIDKLILTHGDTDHIGGALSIISELNVKQILMPSVVSLSETETHIVGEAKKRGIPVLMVSEGNGWEKMDSRFYVLSPEKNFKGERNRGSLTLFAQIGGLTWFFGGDLDQEGEKEIIKKYPNLTIDVLKAGHHGSKTSSAEDFIKQVHPSIALISVGEKNRFGHPNTETLERLQRANIKIFRTDRQGAITYQFSQKSGTFLTFLP